MSSNAFDKLAAFLSELELKGISYTLAHNRDEAILVLAALPGERWEIEFLSDGSVEIERFISDGEISGEEVLGGLTARFEEQSEAGASPEDMEAVTAGSER